MKASIPSRHHPPQAAQKPLIWLEFSLVRVARRGAAVAVAVAGVAAIQVLCCEGGETEESYWGKSQTPNPKPKSKAQIQSPNPKPKIQSLKLKTQTRITGRRDTETQRILVFCIDRNWVWMCDWLESGISALWAMDAQRALETFELEGETEAELRRSYLRRGVLQELARRALLRADAPVRAVEHVEHVSQQV